MNTRANKAVYSPRLHFPNIKLNPGHMLPVWLINPSVNTLIREFVFKNLFSSHNSQGLNSFQNKYQMGEGIEKYFEIL